MPPSPDELTVFVITTRDEPLESCHAALDAQTCTFQRQEIAGVYPMGAAFQAMPDRCTTPYFVQVDADMILAPEAIATLYEAIRSAPPWIYMVAAKLHEEGVGQRGSLKCWKRSLFRWFAFRDVRTVDRDLHRRTRRFGLRLRPLDAELGLHRATHSDYATYLKAKADVEKWRFLGRPPEMYALPILGELLAEPPADSSALLGHLLGAVTWGPRLNRSKDARYERTLREHLDELLGGGPPQRAGTVDPTGLPELFAAAYAAPLGRPSAEREGLAERILAAYGRGGDAGARDRLLELTSR